MITQFLKNENELKINIDYKIFPDIEDRAFWEKAKENSLCFFEKMYEFFGENPREHLTASLYREYKVNGNRKNFENIYFQRRCELITKVLLECMYNDGRFMNDITDLTWMILEESTWCVPAHEVWVKDADILPDFNHQTLDLFAAETACTMAFVYQTVGDRLDEISKIFKRRIKDRVNRFILDDYLSRNDYWWMGFTGEMSNNWCSWINSNIIVAAIILAEDEEKLRKIIYKAIKSVDVYIESHPVDGACDEGPSYWNHAGLTMLENLWLLRNITDGQLDFFKEEQVINTLEYFMKVYTGNGESVNFADGGTKLPIYYASIYKFAKLTENETMKQFAKQLYNDAPLMNIQRMNGRNKGIVTKVLRMLDIATYMGELKNLKESGILKPDYYLESINVMTSKAEFNPLKGLYLSAKGGHNDESHNHNDVGQFIVYKNGEKFIVDIGCMIYSKITFSEQRYTLISTRSAYHNVPLIDGMEQKCGKQYGAKNVEYKNEEDKVRFSLDISKAYENKDDIEKWVRSFEHNKKKREIKITEDFCFSKPLEYELHFITPCNTELTDEGIVLTSPNGEILNIDFDVKKIEFSVENIEIKDDYLKGEWGEKLYKISLKSLGIKDKFSYIIH